MSAAAEMTKLLRELSGMSDVSRSIRFEQLEEQYGKGFATSVRREFERQQLQQGSKR